jgi:hypothetical protein
MSWLKKRHTNPSTPTPSRTILVGGVAAQPAVVPPADHDAAWEYLYLASEIARGLGDLEDRFTHYMSGEVIPSGITVTDPVTDAPARSKDIGEVGPRIDALFAPQLLEKAFGPPGVAGVEATLREVARGVVGVFQTCLQWGEEIRGKSVPAEWQSLYAALADFVTFPMRQIRNFSSELSGLAKNIADAVRAEASPPAHQELTLRISINSAAVERFEGALKALQGSH